MFKPSSTVVKLLRAVNMFIKYSFKCEEDVIKGKKTLVFQFVRVIKTGLSQVMALNA